MQPFQYVRPASTLDVLASLRSAAGGGQRPDTAFLAGGTTLMDLMKLGVMQPARLIDLTALANDHGRIRLGSKHLLLGAFAKMADAAAHPDVRKHYPVVAQSLSLAASAQLRNMASLGGNVLQRTRCAYFRDPSWAACNKRTPGSGCAAAAGANRQHAVLGTSEQCIAAYPGDFAQALLALDASVSLLGPKGPRTLLFRELHRLPQDTPHRETRLQEGEIITGFLLPVAPWTHRSLYVKIRDRQSYEFAVASVAVALDLDGLRVRQARIALGGVASVPWRAGEAEDLLRGKVLDAGLAAQAAKLAFSRAVAQSHNAFKIRVGQAAVVRALLQAARMEADHG